MSNNENELLRFKEFSALYIKKTETEEKLQKTKHNYEELSSQTSDEYAKKKNTAEPKKPLTPYVAFPWGVILFGFILAVLLVGAVIAVISIISSFAKGDVDGITLGTQLCFICIPIIIVAIIVSIKWIIPNFAEELDSLQRDISDKKSYPTRMEKYKKDFAKWEKQNERLKKEYEALKKLEFPQAIKSIQQEIDNINKDLKSYESYIKAFECIKIGKEQYSLENIKDELMDRQYNDIKDSYFETLEFAESYKNLFHAWRKLSFEPSTIIGVRPKRTEKGFYCKELEEVIIKHLSVSNEVMFPQIIKKIAKAMLLVNEQALQRASERRENRKAWALCNECINNRTGCNCPMAPREECEAFRAINHNYGSRRRRW